MSLVLAIEPDSAQADRLRQLVRDRVDAELVVVTSAYAAIVAMNRQAPTLLLFGRSVAQRHQNTVLKHLRSLTEGEVPQALTIPSLGPGEPAAKQGSRFGFGWNRQTATDVPDPSRFTEQISAALASASRGRKTLAKARPSELVPMPRRSEPPKESAPKHDEVVAAPQASEEEETLTEAAVRDDEETLTESAVRDDDGDRDDALIKPALQSSFEDEE